ncbi:PX domain-containing protein kinase-like protein [Plutella xylostella]|uniref:PX domain-containing protein kinase-like protein n=1 Tax=Plutella xylostella TaxID=51655 RepID=UPI002032D309|nr:PX domain-containing protein kinase-like protein [Plutella xylostella]
MAIFEKTPQTKAILDDTEKLVCTIANAQNINKHTEYILRVHRGVSKEDKWNVSHRYRDFAALHGALQAARRDLPLPPKKLLGNMHPSFIAERQIALQNYINEVLKHTILALSLNVRCFLDPSNYPDNLAEQALQTVSIALRGEGRYELKGPLPDIGWRIRKHYFMVTDTESHANCLLCWQSYGPDRHLCDKDLQTAFKCLQNLSHPHIDQILAIHNLETGAYVVRKVHETGTLRDMIYGTEYSKSYLSKYGNPKTRKPLTDGQIAHYGLQLLQALKFLHDKGLPHGHIHPGNIAIENQKVLLLDIENTLLGVANVHRPYIREHRKTSSAEAIDVYSFGRTLYEMALAETLDEPYCDIFPCNMSNDLVSVLRLCLSSSSCKHGMPTIESLLRHPLFSRPLVMGNGVHSDGATSLRVPSQLKEEIKMAVAVMETRLKAEQKLVRGAKREVRIQEILGSEEEMRKQKRRAKKRESVWKSTSSLAETVRSQSVSTASSPTPPHHPSDAPACTNGSSSTSASSAPLASPVAAGGTQQTKVTNEAPATNGRSALLSAICSFDKTRLSRINSG